MKVLFDTNVILDIWLARESFWEAAAALMARAEEDSIEGWICPTTVTTLHYVSRKELGERKARSLIESLMQICRVGDMTKRTLANALSSDLSDYEDAVLEALAIENQIECIATRNLRDFRKSRISAKEPSGILADGII